jgi:hypothetical protein
MTAKRTLLLRALTVTSALCIAIVPRVAFAQAAPAADQTTTTTTTTTAAPAAVTTTPGTEEEAVVLSPFVVDSSEEKGSYKANSTLAGTRVRTDLADVASALSVVTAQFLQDTGSTNTQDLLVYTTNTEVAGLNGNFSGQAGNAVYQENTLTPSTTTRVRGLSAADNTRDYFLTDIPWDSFNVGRVDLQRGPNSILFGVGSPGGIINNDINEAEFTNTNNVQDRFDEFGSLRNSADFNYVLIPNVLAIRLAWVNDEEKYEQQYAFNNTTRYYGALRYDPVIFGKDNHTSIRAKFEKGNVDSNNPRSLPPADELTPWFSYGKPVINQWTPGSDSSSTVYARIPAFGGNGPTWAEGRSYWPDVLSYYNGTQGLGVNSGTPTYVEAAMINDTTATNALSGPLNHTIGDLPYYRLSGIPDYSFYATNNIPGGSYYSDKVITDPSIFDFYKKLLDGPNKKEWQRWTALNASVSQTFFHDRLGFELVYDTQHYNNGQVAPLGGATYAISVDVNETYADGTPNPNFGRPFVAASGAYAGSWGTTDRNSLRLTGTAEVRGSDFFNKDSWAAQILGRQVVTGLLEEDIKGSMNVSYSEYATDEQWEINNNVALTTSLQSNRQFDWVDYIGPNLLGQSSASGINLNGITNIIAPSPVETVRNFNTTWNAPTVNPAAPFSYLDGAVPGQVDTNTQADNPANYVGFQNQQVNWLSSNNPTQFPDLVTGASKAHYADISSGFTWQGNMFDGTVVPTFGWRKDSVVNYATNAPQQSQSVFYTTDFSEDPTTRRQAIGETKAWGGVYHFPKFLTSWLPWGTTFSVFYDHNANFEAQAPRTSLAGATLPNPTGKTKEEGFTISTLNDKVTLKVDWYNTEIQNATFDSSNDGGTGYQLWAVPSWGYEYATALQVGMQGNGNASNPIGNYLWNYGYSDQTNGNSAVSAGHTGNTQQTENVNDPDWALQQQIVNAWVHIPITDQFYQAFGIHTQGSTITPSAALASGNLISAFQPGWNADSPGGSQPGPLNPVTTVDTLSKGEEFELSAQPIRNWNITVNYARTFATHSNIDALTQAFMKNLNTFFAGPGGQVRLWGDGYGNQIGPGTWTPNVYDEYLVEVNSEGTSSPEVSPWRFNLTTTYTFDRGKLKGYFIGGAARLEAGRILGYQYSPTLGTLDISKPWIGANDEHYDLWLGYSRRIFANKINWRIQANMKNIFEKDHLVPAQVEPDGSLALDRIQEGMTWQLTNSFDF